MTTNSVWAIGRTGRTIVMQVRRNGDLIEEIKNVCDHNGINSAILSCCIGALAEGNLLNPIPKKNGELCPGYADAITLEGPIQLLSTQGTVSKGKDNSLVVHMHGVVADSKNKIYGGHFVSGKNRITFAGEVIIQEIDPVIRTKFRIRSL